MRMYDSELKNRKTIKLARLQLGSGAGVRPGSGFRVRLVIVRVIHGKLSCQSCILVRQVLRALYKGSWPIEKKDQSTYIQYKLTFARTFILSFPVSAKL